MDHYQEGFDFTYKWMRETKNWVPALPNEIAAEHVNLYDFLVQGAKFDKQVTEGLLLPKFKQVEVDYELGAEGQFWVHKKDLEKLFKLKLEP